MDEDSEVEQVIENRKPAEGKYTWVTSPSVPWDWGENVWTERLFHCLRDSLAGVQVVPAFKWGAKTYKSDISTLFPNIMGMAVAPFQGMTDLLLLGESSLALVRTGEDCVCCIEVGCRKDARHLLTIAGALRAWPEKVGELLSSMYYFATVNYLNKLRSLPSHVTWTTYGILVMRMAGCIVLEMVLDSDGCHVSLIYEGCTASLGPAVEYVAGLIHNQS